MKALKWAKEQTTQYNLRFMNATGIPEAVKNAVEQTGEATAEYLKNAVVQRLKSDGFLREDAPIVLNLNRQRHKDRLAQLEKYLAQEKQKLNIR